MHDVENRIVQVPGAALYCKLRGQGPLLVIIQGGAGDADGCEAFADALARAAISRADPTIGAACRAVTAIAQ